MNEKQTLIDSLIDIRSNLRATVREAHGFSAKLTGPIPPDPGNPEVAQESIAGVVADIRTLTLILGKVICEHHDFVGNFAMAIPTNQIGGSAGRPRA